MRLFWRRYTQGSSLRKQISEKVIRQPRTLIPAFLSNLRMMSIQFGPDSIQFLGAI